MKPLKWQHLIGLAVLVLIAITVLLYKIDKQYMWTDEIFSFNAAQMIIEKGEPLYDSGLLYERAPAYHFLLAESMELFGQNEFGSRVVNIPFAIGTMLLTFFFTTSILKERKGRFCWGIGASLLYLTANFTLASVRETRMYTMETFLLTVTIFSFYKAFIQGGRTSSGKVFGAKIRYDLIYSLLFIASFGLAFNTQPITILLIPGIAIFLLITAFLKRQRKILLFLVLIGLLAIFGIYFRYQTLDINTILQSLTPEWPNSAVTPLYYPILLVRNFPGVFLLSPVILWTTYRFRKTSDIYLLTIFLTYLVIIAIQPAQSERYLIPILPILVILFVISVSGMLKALLKKSESMYRYALTFVILVVGLPHIYLFTRELNEIDMYTHTSIYIHKKFEFNSLFEYLEQQDLSNMTLIADEHSAYTLYEKGFKPSYILSPDQKISNREIDLYFDTPFLSYKEAFPQYLYENSGKPLILVLRNYEDFKGIESYMSRVDGFNKPRVYKVNWQ